MRQLTFLGKGKLAWREAPEPRIEDPGDVLVRPLAVARCDLDRTLLLSSATKKLRLGHALHLLHTDVTALLGTPPFRAPFAFGHECVADIVSCGEGVRDYRAGERVIVPFQISCGVCDPCMRGLTGTCAAVPPLSVYGFGKWGGALSDCLRVPFADRMLVALPAGIDPISVASASDNLPDAWRTVAPHLRERPGAPVLIVGGGAPSVGLYAVAMAVALGSSQVDYVDSDAQRLATAQSLGANVIEGSPPALPRQYPITVDASAKSAGLRLAIGSTESWGVCTSVGIYFKRGESLPLFAMYAKGVRFHTGPANSRADLPAILELIASRRLQPERVTTRIARWNDAPEALLDSSAKVIIGLH